MSRGGSIGVALALGMGIWVGAEVRAEGEGPDAARVEFFEAKVRPVLANHCFECHGPKKQKGGLRLDSIEAIRKGGDSGPAIEPGNPENSLLIEAIGYRDDALVQMPPSGKLDEADIDALTDWVKMGAPWPASQGESLSASSAPHAAPVAGADFWSFQPVCEPTLPSVQDTSWPQSPIDRFILAKLEANGLKPAPPAAKRTLIRRVTFDLIGLPPTPAETEAFLADDSPQAFAKVVDRLLASPHYGERWGRYWLDVARYGEDQAHSFKPRLYPNGFRYRDWVTKALNTDLPYDRFLIEQVAGDLLDELGRKERLPALGFFACGPVYYGDPKKLDQVADRIDTMCRGFLGLTVACARCHDHKYDPIPTTDYYALAGVFLSTDYAEAPIAPEAQVEAYQRAMSAIGSMDEEIKKFLHNEADHLAATRAGATARYLVAAWTFHQRQARDPRANAGEIAREEGLDVGLLRRWVSYLDKAKPEQRPALADWLALWKQAASPSSQGDRTRFTVELAAQGFQEQLLALLALRQGPSGARTATSAQSDGSPLDAQARALLDDLVGEQGFLAVPERQVEKAMPGSSRARLEAMRAELEKLKKAAPPKYDEAHTLKEGRPTNMQVLIRGNPETPGPEVPRRFLTILGGARAPFTQGSGRLELARALASPDNPLTARVMVNRIWQHHFGRGLVATPSNFGALGDRPSHPELLDWLAHEFVARGWSIKAMHRLILLSSTYQQSSQFDLRAAEIDPANRLLWRMNRRRLDVEAWRDALLAVSGRLNATLGGPSFKLGAEDNGRRTYYAAISRHDLAPLLRLFDFPDPNITSSERTETTVPLQQLYVLNDEFLVQTAQALAARLTVRPEEDDAARIERAYLLLFSRPPTASERRLGLAFLQTDSADGGDLTRWQRYAQVLLGTNEFAFLD
jgi:cytochrome c553